MSSTLPDLIVGIDEVGRGSWAGPVVASAVLLKHDVDGLADSKLLTPRKRRVVAQQIRSSAPFIGIGWVDAATVDVLGLNEAVQRAMQGALDGLSHEYTTVIIDGHINYLERIDNTQAVVDADANIPAVSAASVIAKVARDTFMQRVAKRFPDYGFERHVGYGTKLHQQRLAEHGACTLHRKSYKPVQAVSGVN